MRVGRILVLTAAFFLFGTYAYAADCNNGGSYEGYNDGTVTNCRTGLIWLKNANCGNTMNGITPDTVNGTTWYDAMKWVASLGDTGNPSTGCGLSDGSSAGDWRLPTKTEWMAMVAFARNAGYTNPTLQNGTGTGQWTNGDVFNNVQPDDYWSSTTYASTTGYAWSVNLWFGSMVYNFKTSLNYVWPVRGGQSGSFGSLTIE